MRLLFLFLDGVGLGPADPAARPEPADRRDPGANPFARAEMPNLIELLGGRRLVAGVAPVETPRATLLELDACLGSREHRSQPQARPRF